jgi:four helix bundle protein
MDHEKLDVYRVTLEVVTRIHQILRSQDSDRSLRDQVVRSSTSTLLNIAEGTGKRSQPDRRRYYEIARGSAMETAAALDVLVAWQYASQEVGASHPVTLTLPVTNVESLQ